jgi:hypothetical protein
VLRASICPLRATKNGFRHLTTLRSLEEFSFVFEGDSYAFKNDLFLTWCYEILPQLHIAGFKAEPGVCRMLLMTVGTDVSTALRRVRRRAGCRGLQLQLRNLALTKELRFLNDIDLPQLKVLFLRSPLQINLLDLSRLPNLDTLDAFDLTDIQMLQVLAAPVGHQLKCLHLYDRAVVQLDEVLERCPNLSELSLCVFSFQIPPTFQPHPFLHLTDVSIRTSKSYFSRDFTAPLLQLIRLAPNLRSLHLHLPMSSGQELIDLVQLAGHGYLQHLEKLEVALMDLADVSDDELETLLQSFVSHCSKLQTLELDEVDE